MSASDQVDGQLLDDARGSRLGCGASVPDPTFPGEGIEIDAIAPANYLNQPLPVVEQVLTRTFADGLGNGIDLGLDQDRCSEGLFAEPCACGPSALPRGRTAAMSCELRAEQSGVGIRRAV